MTTRTKPAINPHENKLRKNTHGASEDEDYDDVSEGEQQTDPRQNTVTPEDLKKNETLTPENVDVYPPLSTPRHLLIESTRQNGSNLNKVDKLFLTNRSMSIRDDKSEASGLELERNHDSSPKKSRWGQKSPPKHKRTKSPNLDSSQEDDKAGSGGDTKQSSVTKKMKEKLAKKMEMRRESRQRKIKEQNYFVADSAQDPLRVKEHDILFKFSQFFEFLFYHIVFFFLLGPLSFIVLYPTAGKNLTRNMGFFGWNAMFINQCIQWSFLFSAFLLYFVAENTIITYIEIYMIITAVFLRICTIAAKYGSTHPLRIKLLKSKVLTYAELTEDFMLIKWRDQTDDVIEQELIAAIKRNDIDTALFFFSFLADVDDKMREELTKTPDNKFTEKSKNVIAYGFMGFGVSGSQKSLDNQKSLDHQSSGVSQHNQHDENGASKDKSDMDENKSEIAMKDRGYKVKDNEHKVKSTSPRLQHQPRSPIVSHLNSFDDSLDNTVNMNSEHGEGNKKEEKQEKPIPKKKKTNLLNAALNNLEALNMFSAVNLCRKIIYNSKKKAIPKILHVGLFLSLIRACIPLFYRIVVHEPIIGNTMAERYMAISYILTNTYFFGANLAFVLVGLSDLMKKYYLMSQLSQLISVRKVEEYESEKIFPTLNLFDPFSLKAWLCMHKIFMDFGRKYFLRINLNISMFLFFYFIVAVLLILQFFKIINIFKNSLLNFVFLYEILLICGIILRSILFGAKINDHFRVHRLILNKNRIVLGDLLKLDDIYFPIVESKFKPANLIYQEAQRKIYKLLKFTNIPRGSEESAIAIQDYLSKLVDYVSESIDDLDFESQGRPIKILGFVTSFALIKNILVGLMSLGFAVFQQLFSSGNGI